MLATCASSNDGNMVPRGISIANVSSGQSQVRVSRSSQACNQAKIAVERSQGFHLGRNQLGEIQLSEDSSRARISVESEDFSQE